MALRSIVSFRFVSDQAGSRGSILPRREKSMVVVQLSSSAVESRSEDRVRRGFSRLSLHLPCIRPVLPCDLGGNSWPMPERWTMEASEGKEPLEGETLETFLLRTMELEAKFIFRARRAESGKSGAVGGGGSRQ